MTTFTALTLSCDVMAPLFVLLAWIAEAAGGPFHEWRGVAVALAVLSGLNLPAFLLAQRANQSEERRLQAEIRLAKLRHELAREQIGHFHE